jgi:hypothetical protein
MSVLKYVSNGETIYPELPIAKPLLVIEEGRRMLNGQGRWALRAQKATLAYGRGNLSEAELTTWIAAHPGHISFNHTDEVPVTRVMKRTNLTITLERTEPVEEGGLDTTGLAYYRVDVELEEV